MNLPRETKIAAIKASYGLALDEIRLRYSMNASQALMQNLEDEKLIVRLEGKIDYMRKQLASLQAKRRE